MTKIFLILPIALFFALGSMIACTASERSANDKVSSAGGTEQSASMNTDNKPANNKSTENKMVAEKEILWDFRKSDGSQSQTFSKSETDAVVKYLFGDQTSKKIEIRNRFTGSFTKPNVKETLYYLSGCKDENDNQFTTDCPHVSWDTEGWIAIFDGTTPVIKINEALGSNIEKMTDINGDGINEILSFGGYAQSGQVTQSAGIGQISNEKYQNIKDFDGYADNCAFGDTLAADKKKAVAGVINFTPTTDGKIPEFTEEYFQGQCKNDELDQSSWKKITKKEFDAFYKSLS